MAGHLIGREPDLLRIEPLLAGLDEGRGGLALITGEPGIGKTRLVQEVMDRLRSRGVRTAWATAWPDAGAPPLWVWQQAFTQLDQSSGVLSRATSPSVEAADVERFAQFADATETIRRSAESGPIAIVIDDLQWADPASVRLLEFAAALIHDRPCLLVGVARHAELSPDDLLDLTRLGDHLSLRGLDADGVLALLAQSVDVPVADAVHEVVASRSGGNPLFVREFARLLSGSGRTDVASAAVPLAVAAVLERRLARLSESVVATLQAAAILGKEFDLVTLERLAAASDVSEGVRPDIEISVRDGLVTDLGAGRLVFAHDLIREVVLGSLSVKRRTELHRAAASLISADLGQDPALHAELAHHLQESDDRVGAAHQWELAAHWHLDRLGFEQAATWFGRAAWLSAEPARRTDLLLAQADAFLRAGQLSPARQCFADAAQLALTEGDSDRLVIAVLGIGAGAAAWEVPVSDPAYTRLIHAALAQLGTDATAQRSSLLARLSVASATPETLERSRALAVQARDLAVESADPALEAQALAALSDALSGPHHVRERLELSNEIITLADRAGDRGLGLLGTRFRVVALLELGDFAELDKVIADFERRADELRQPLLSWYAPLFRGMRALLLGHPADAELHLAAVTEVAERTGSINARLLSATLRMGIDAACGRITDLSILDVVVDDMADVMPESWASYAAGVSYLCVRAGEVERASTYLRMHSDGGFARIGDDSEHLATLMFFGRTALQLGETAAARLVYEALLPFSGLWIVDGIAAVCWGPVDLELGRLAGGLGLGDAASHLDSAADAVSAAGAKLLETEVADLRSALGDTRESGAAPTVASAINEWVREGEFWTLAYAGRTVHMKHSKGLADLAVLLATPTREVHVADLYGDTPRPANLATGGDLGEQLDATARAAYRRRLQDLDSELDEAAAANDLGRVDQLTSERDFLLAELSAALGLAGRSRRTGDPVERMRKAVGMRIRLAIDRLADSHPALAAHLRNSVKTGIFCQYAPETPVDWRT